MKTRNPIPWSRFRQAIEARGLPIDQQAYFYRVGRGRRVVHISRKDPVTRVDLKGLDDLSTGHRAVRPISKEEATTKHLGLVRGTLDFNRGENEILAAFDAALERIQEEDGIVGPPPGAGGAQREFAVTVPADLAAAIDGVCRELKATVPRGLDSEVTPISTIRVLLNEAIQARTLPAPALTPEEEDGLHLALRQAREGKLHGRADARRVIDSVVRR